MFNNNIISTVPAEERALFIAALRARNDEKAREDFARLVAEHQLRLKNERDLPKRARMMRALGKARGVARGHVEPVILTDAGAFVGLQALNAMQETTKLLAYDNEQPSWAEAAALVWAARTLADANVVRRGKFWEALNKYHALPFEAAIVAVGKKSLPRQFWKRPTVVLDADGNVVRIIFGEAAARAESADARRHVYVLEWTYYGGVPRVVEQRGDVIEGPRELEAREQRRAESITLKMLALQALLGLKRGHGVLFFAGPKLARYLEKVAGTSEEDRRGYVAAVVARREYRRAVAGAARFVGDAQEARELVRASSMRVKFVLQNGAEITRRLVPSAVERVARALNAVSWEVLEDGAA